MRKQLASRPGDVWPYMWKFMSDAAKKKARQTWTVDKPKLDNARRLRGIFFIERNEKEFKLTMNAARNKLEVPMQAAMRCKIQKEHWRNPSQYLETKDKIRLLSMPTKERDEG